MHACNFLACFLDSLLTLFACFLDVSFVSIVPICSLIFFVARIIATYFLLRLFFSCTKACNLLICILTFLHPFYSHASSFLSIISIPLLVFISLSQLVICFFTSILPSKHFPICFLPFLHSYMFTPFLFTSCFFSSSVPNVLHTSCLLLSFLY